MRVSAHFYRQSSRQALLHLVYNKFLVFLLFFGPFFQSSLASFFAQSGAAKEKHPTIGWRAVFSSLGERTLFCLSL